MGLIDKFLGKTVTRRCSITGKKRKILVTEVDENGKYGYPTLSGKLVRQDEGYDSTKIGEKVWCYVEDVFYVELNSSKVNQE